MRQQAPEGGGISGVSMERGRRTCLLAGLEAKPVESKLQRRGYGSDVAWRRNERNQFFENTRREQGIGVT